MVDEMRLDDTIDAKELSLEPVDAQAVISRIATIGETLRVHECFISMLGVADVQIERLPNSLKIGIYWNEQNQEGLELYITIGAGYLRESILQALKKYLAPSLEGE